VKVITTPRRQTHVSLSLDRIESKQTPTAFFSHQLYHTMAGDPQETWKRLQQQLQSAQQRGRSAFGGAGGGGSPRGAIGGVAGLLLLAGGAVVFNNSIFNGMKRPWSSCWLLG